ncbi:MAG: hypothetical protein Q7R83_02530 [bacterium]|nr:hypothetical protein [bacterium]
MFLNCSNHPVSKWGEAQILAAQRLGGEVTDLPFPNVNPHATTEEIVRVAEALAAKVSDGAVVMGAGRVDAHVRPDEDPAGSGRTRGGHHVRATRQGGGEGRRNRGEDCRLRIPWLPRSAVIFLRARTLCPFPWSS